MLTTTLSISGMSLSQSRTESLFLTDKMAYELQLSASQYDAVYEINLDYFLSLRSSSDIYGSGWTRRDIDLGYVLSNWQYNRYRSVDYFYRPVYWSSGWRYSIYSTYTNRSHFYYSRPSVYSTYKGAHSWRNNGNKSWYRGRTFDNSHKMNIVNRPSGNHSYGKPQGTTHNWRTDATRPNKGTNTVRPVPNRPDNGKNNGTVTKPTTNRGNGKTNGNISGNGKNNGTNRPSGSVSNGGNNKGNSQPPATNRGGSFGGKR